MERTERDEKGERVKSDCKGDIFRKVDLYVIVSVGTTIMTRKRNRKVRETMMG